MLSINFIEKIIGYQKVIIKNIEETVELQYILNSDEKKVAGIGHVR